MEENQSTWFFSHKFWDETLAWYTLFPVFSLVIIIKIKKHTHTHTYPQEALFKNKAQDHWHSSEDTNLEEKLCIQSSTQSSVLGYLSPFFNCFTNTGECLEQKCLFIH
jgi:hypothetical protein